MAFPLEFPWGSLGREAGLLRQFWQGRFWPGDLAWNGRFGRHKTAKRSLAGLSKLALRWYIPLAPKGIAKGCLLRKPPDGIGASGVGQFVSAFRNKARNGLSRGGAAR
jgi:hypothetical protein